jgi:hypothetical protein
MSSAMPPPPPPLLLGLGDISPSPVAKPSFPARCPCHVNSVALVTRLAINDAFMSDSARIDSSDLAGILSIKMVEEIWNTFA